MEILTLLAIVLLLFGAKRIPELARGLGSGVREFRKGVSGQDENVESREREGHADLPQAEKPETYESHSQVKDAPAKRTV